MLFFAELLVDPTSAVSVSSIVSLPREVKTSRCSFLPVHTEVQQYQQLYPFSFGQEITLPFFDVPSSLARDQQPSVLQGFLLWSLFCFPLNGSTVLTVWLVALGAYRCRVIVSACNSCEIHVRY